jgi:AbrB family looped-hinge helix DNA binding protein
MSPDCYVRNAVVVGVFKPTTGWASRLAWAFNLVSPTLFSYHFAIDGDRVMAASDTATLSAKFQISIPKAIRTARHWQAGQVFAFIPKGEGVLLVPVPKREELAGLARGARPRGYRDRTDRLDRADRDRV